MYVAHLLSDPHECVCVRACGGEAAAVTCMNRIEYNCYHLGGEYIMGIWNVYILTPITGQLPQ